MPTKRARGRPRGKATEDGDESDEDYGKPAKAKAGGGRPGRPKRQAAPKNGNYHFVCLLLPCVKIKFLSQQ